MREHLLLNALTQQSDLVFQLAQVVEQLFQHEAVMGRDLSHQGVRQMPQFRMQPAMSHIGQRVGIDVADDQHGQHLARGTCQQFGRHVRQFELIHFQHAMQPLKHTRPIAQ